jgi:hypothetical protein
MRIVTASHGEFDKPVYGQQRVQQLETRIEAANEFLERLQLPVRLTVQIEVVEGAMGINQRGYVALELAPNCSPQDASALERALQEAIAGADAPVKLHVVPKTR